MSDTAEERRPVADEASTADLDAVDQEVLKLYNQLSGQVRGYLVNLGTPADAVESIVNDAFLALRSASEAVQNPRAYVYQVARNQRCRLLKETAVREAQIVPLPVQSELETRLTVADHAMAIVEKHAIRAALTKLPTRQREVLLLHIVGDFRISDIATILRRPTGTIKSDLRRGRAALGKLLSAAEEANEQ